MSELALVRHGETEWNRLRRYQGRTDVPLNETGRDQARAAGASLARFEATQLVSSPLLRARETAEIIGQPRGLELSATRPDLIERNFGIAEGVDSETVLARWPDGAIPGAEPADAVAERGVRALRELLDAGEPAIVVAHGTLLRLALAELTGQAIPRIGNAEVIMLGPDHTIRWDDSVRPR